MFDLHSHLIPGIDDGARDMEEAIALLRIAEQEGISHMVITPHIHPGQFDNTSAIIQQGLSELKAACATAGVAVQLAAAAEVRLSSEILQWTEQGMLPFIGQYQGFNVLLLELPHSHVPAGADKLVKWLLNKNILPMIAHPERNRDVQADPAKLAPFIRLDCLFQLTASSVLGDMGERSAALSEQLLKQKLFSIMATDSHNLLRRPPKLQQAAQRVSQLVSDDYAEQLVLHTPKLISEVLFAS
ncbi:capsule biosynthesis protein CapC [Rheinheimera sediminis]|uniref:tyrosine-protein phosphatase n=1 Tax=Rheinheimera sp. YQF-1 TaxID=2499626 RepID=UPI000FD7AEB1|nr:CpsB/CapC family capsule biosynthesis tyrosine phosphatase [Rheinheimera sp. YQF-1]RVT49239.1 capsule biosynthesis protein CapC [Rheinheimera sp. YQF-1]